MSKKCLIVDDEDLVRESLVDILSDNENYDVRDVPSAEEAREVLERDPIHVMVTDLKMEGMTGDELLEWTKDNHPLTQVIMITAHGSIEHAVEAMRKGAFNYLTKPFSPETVEAEVERALEHRELKAENEVLRSRVESDFGTEFVGESPALDDVFDQIHSIKDNDVSVLITGESGTGKELVANTIHEEGSRSDGPFVVVDCGTLPENIVESELFGHKKGAFTGAEEPKTGKVELADGGTLLLDEIGNLSPDLQAKLLRFLQEKEFTPIGGTEPRSVDTRILAATNVDIEKAIEAGQFREDLYYRLNVVHINIPPLRERREDIPALARYFLNHYGSEINPGINRIDDSVMELLNSHDWPGNVRELENCIKHALVMADGDAITPEDLPGGFDTETPTSNETVEERDLTLEEVERRHILRVIEDQDWNLSAATRILGINRTTLYNKIDKYDLREHEPSG
jgi:DNA-binding NtrC family response regulator